MNFPSQGGRIPPVGSHDHKVIERFRHPNKSSWEGERSKSSLWQLRSAVEIVIQQNRDKGLSRYDFPGARFRSVVEELRRPKKAYTYEPIDHHHEIRILRVHRGKKADALKCTLFPSSLPSTRSTSKSNSYEYLALSFEWGEHKFNDQITVYCDLEEGEGFQHVTISNRPCTLYIRPNLGAALRNMRQEIEDIDLWVDAVCINQADIAEKKAQVALMDRIYKEATSILVWLGGSNLDASLAFNLLKLLADLRAQDDLPDTKAKADSWASVINLTKKSYWRRVWILQELEFSKKAEVAWGSETIKLETMARAWSTILTKRKQVEAILHRAGWDDSSAQYFFNRVTAQIEFQSNPCTIRASWVDQTFERERVTSAAGIQDHDDDFEEATAPEFRCQYCLAEKSTLGQLDRHIRTHTLPYRCDFQGCEIGKATQRDLDRHMDAHLKIRRYFCPVKGCPWHPNGPTGGFSRRLDNAKRHLKSHIDYHDLSVLRENS